MGLSFVITEVKMIVIIFCVHVIHGPQLTAFTLFRYLCLYLLARISSFLHLLRSSVQNLLFVANSSSCLLETLITASAKLILYVVPSSGHSHVSYHFSKPYHYCCCCCSYYVRFSHLRTANTYFFHWTPFLFCRLFILKLCCLRKISFGFCLV